MNSLVTIGQIYILVFAQYILFETKPSFYYILIKLYQYYKSDLTEGVGCIRLILCVRGAISSIRSPKLMAQIECDTKININDNTDTNSDKRRIFHNYNICVTESQPLYSSTRGLKFTRSSYILSISHRTLFLGQLKKSSVA